MMTPQQLEDALVNLTQAHAQLRADNESSQQVFAQLRKDNESLLRESNAFKSQYLALSQSVTSVVRVSASPMKCSLAGNGLIFYNCAATPPG